MKDSSQVVAKAVSLVVLSVAMMVGQTVECLVEMKGVLSVLIVVVATAGKRVVSLDT